MTAAQYEDIWNRTLRSTLNIRAEDTGMSDSTARRYEAAAELSDDEIWEKMQAGEL